MMPAQDAPESGAILFTEAVSVPTVVDHAMRNNGALVISVSGGKDSDAMTHTLLALYRERGWNADIHLIHADLGRAEWRQTAAYVELQAERHGLPLHVVRHPRGDLIDGMQRRRLTRPDAPPFPSSAARWCTSDYKRNVICGWIRQHFPHNRTVICAMGLRAEESPARARRPVLSLRTTASAPTKNRTVYDWLPIHDFTLDQVWRTLGYTLESLSDIQRDCRAVMRSGGDGFTYLQQIGFSAHPAYALGNQRLSCGLCVLASTGDLENGAEHNPDLYRQLVDLERASGFAFRQHFWLADLRPDLLTAEQQAWREGERVISIPPKPATPPKPIQLSLFE